MTSQVIIAATIARISLEHSQWEHSQRVALHFEGEHLQTLAYLHQVLDEGEVTMNNLVDLGIKVSTVLEIDKISPGVGRSKKEYIQRIADRASDEALSVKIVELQDCLENFYLIPAGDESFLKKSLQLLKSELAIRTSKRRDVA